LLELAREDERAAQLEQELCAPGRGGREQGGCTVKEVGGGRNVAAPQGAPSCGGESLAGTGGQVLVCASELGLQAVRLLEVIADDLLDLAKAIAMCALEPAGVALVQVGAPFLGRRRIGRVAN
jgi:hypothetical protein